MRTRIGLALIVRVLMLFAGCSLALAATAADESDELISKLSSASQPERDAAAEKLRKIYVPSKRSQWEPLLNALKAGDTKRSIVDRVYGQGDAKLESLVGSGQSHSIEYRLDDSWLLRCAFRNIEKSNFVEVRTEEPLISVELVERMRHVWVEPPAEFGGVWIAYYVNGQPSHEIEYLNGKYSGSFTAFHSNGRRACVQHYGPDGIDGEDTGYYPSGKVMYRAFYKAGAQVGTWTHYEEDGSVRAVQEHPAAYP